MTNGFVNMGYLTSDLYATNRITPLVPEGYVDGGFPSIRQCVGTNRLWGASLGKALFEDTCEKVEEVKLVDIAILSRSILVIDDHIDDEYLSKRDVGCLLEFKARLEQELFSIYETVGEDISTHEQLCLVSKHEVDSRRICDSAINLYRSAINKCLIFFNPYRLELAKNITMWNDRIHFLEIFFFACQLLDDFQDLTEDRSKNNNQNIFYYQRSDSECAQIERLQAQWAPTLLMKILLNLRRSDVIYGVSKSTVFQFFHNEAISFLTLMLSRLNGELTIDDTLMIEFEEWRFDPLANISQDSIQDSQRRYLRPEFMQTYTRGFREIDRV